MSVARFFGPRVVSAIILYFAPASCAKFPLILLEEIGAPFEIGLVRFRTGQHKSDWYRNVNPLGKVPALAIDGEVLTENVAIAYYLSGRFPEARLLPQASDALASARLIADLCFCASTLHPFVTRICVPKLSAPAGSELDVHRLASERIMEYLLIVEDRLRSGDWWYGADWSAMDAYLYWVLWRIRAVGFDFGDLPFCLDLIGRTETRPAVRRALAREAEQISILESEGIATLPHVIQ